MIIRNASFKNIHGHISRKLVFQRGVNVLTGINGSGKTSFLNAIAWTLSPQSLQGGFPAAYLLSTMQFGEITITFKLPGIRMHQRVTAEHLGDTIAVSARGVDDTLTIPVPPPDENIRLSGLRAQQEAADVVTAHLNERRTNLVLQYLRRLPGPLYVPLDRRWHVTEESRYPVSRSRRILSISNLPIQEVLAYADRAYRREQLLTARLNDDLRSKLVASLFEPPPESFQLRQSQVSPTKEMRTQRARISSTLTRLGIPDAQRKAIALFDTMERTAEPLQGLDLANMESDHPQFQALVNWIIYSAPFAERLNRLVAFIEQYEVDRLSTTTSSRSFLASVNRFLADSGKSIEFSDAGVLEVRLLNGKTTEASNLSSGEIQLLILFTFLHFRFEQQEEFTIIIDEPELSLHLEWQNRYLEAITEANHHAQFIVATHSPEIAAPFEDRIIDISPPMRTNA